MITDLLRTIRDLGRSSSEETLEVVREVSPGVEKHLRGIVDRYPVAVFQVLNDFVTDLSDRLGRPDLAAVWRGIGADPRNHREATATLQSFSRYLQRTDPMISKRLERGLAFLESRGALGLERARQVASFLTSVKRRPSLLCMASQGSVRCGDAVVWLDDLEAFEKALQSHSKVWGPRAAQEVSDPLPEEVYGRGDPGLFEDRLPESFGATDEGIRQIEQWTLLKGTVPSTEGARENIRRLHFGLYGLEKLMQSSWWGGFQPDLRFEDCPDASVPGVRYAPEARSLKICSDRVASLPEVFWALASAVDHNLLDYQQFASEAEGHPIQILVQMASEVYPSVPPRRVFERVLEQYLRLYLNQVGSGYGPTEVEGDASVHWVAAFSRTLMDGLVEAQKIDMADGDFRAEDIEQKGLIGAGASSVVLLGLGAGIL